MSNYIELTDENLSKFIKITPDDIRIPKNELLTNLINEGKMTELQIKDSIMTHRYRRFRCEICNRYEPDDQRKVPSPLEFGRPNPDLRIKCLTCYFDEKY